MTDFDENMSDEEKNIVIRLRNENWIKNDEEIATVYGDGMTRAKLEEQRRESRRDYQEFLKKLTRHVRDMRKEKKNGR